MDVSAALADLTEISSQVRTAVLVDADGAVSGWTGGDEARAERLAGAGRELLAAAEAINDGAGRRPSQVEVALREGSIFVVEGERASIVATTLPDPTSGLVLYDLRSCLRALAEPDPEPEPRTPRRSRKKAVGA